MISIRGATDLGAEEIFDKVKDAFFATTQELMEFNDWAKSSGWTLGFNAEEYEPKAVQRGQKYWTPVVREMLR